MTAKSVISVLALGAACMAAVYGAAGTAAAARTSPRPAAPVASGWGTAEEVPGTAALNKGGSAEVVSLSCAKAGYCGAGGFYTGAGGHSQAFVVSEQDGRWLTAEEVSGTAALNKRGDAQVTSVSCARAGDCLAGGFYTDRSGHKQAFVVSERSGRWLKAEELPGTAALDAGGSAAINSVSCGSLGNCAAGGFYRIASGSQQAFVASERNGRWSAAQEVPGSAALNAGGNAAVTSVSCGAAGDCAAGGSYQSSASLYFLTGSYPVQAFVVSERNGRWQTAEEVPGTAALNVAVQATVSSVSCPSASSCLAGGYVYSGAVSEGPWYPEMFVTTATNGRWGNAGVPPVSGALVTGFYDPIVSVSCSSAGNCGVGGYFTTGPDWVSFVASERNGRWIAAQEVPGTAVVIVNGNSAVDSISCPVAGSCGAGGYTGHQEFVVNEVNGHWGSAQQVPGLAGLGWGAAINSVSCPRAGTCEASGYYTAHKHIQAFVSGLQT